MLSFLELQFSKINSNSSLSSVVANSIQIHSHEFKGSQFFNSEFCSNTAEVSYLIAEVEARGILVTGKTRSRALSPHVAPGTVCLE